MFINFYIGNDQLKCRGSIFAARSANGQMRYMFRRGDLYLR